MTATEGFYRRVHGESFLSDWCLPELKPVTDRPAFWLKRMGNESDLPLLRLPRPAHEFAFLQRKILASKCAGVENASTRRLIYDSIIPEYLAQRGCILLRGFSVRWRGSGCLILGGAGVGKSTLSAFLLTAGAEFLGDDIVRITLDEDGCPVAWAGAPWIKLWPSVAEKYAGNLVPSGVVHPDLNKQLFTVPDAARVDSSSIDRLAFVATDDRRDPGIISLDMNASFAALSAMMRMPLDPSAGNPDRAAMLRIFAALVRLPRPRVLFRRGSLWFNDVLSTSLMDDLLA